MNESPRDILQRIVISAETCMQQAGGQHFPALSFVFHYTKKRLNRDARQTAGTEVDSSA